MLKLALFLLVISNINILKAQEFYKHLSKRPIIRCHRFLSNINYRLFSEKSLFDRGLYQDLMSVLLSKKSPLAKEVRLFVENLLENSFTSDDLLDQSDELSMGERINPLFVDLNLGDGKKVKVVFKQNAIGEYLGYEFNKLIGIQRVPITTYRKLGGMHGSVQLYLNSSKTGENLHFWTPFTSEKMTTIERNENNLFRLLSGSSDDHSGNRLYSYSNAYYIIDNDRAFSGGVPWIYWPKVNFEEFIPRKFVLEKVRKYDEKELREIFTKTSKKLKKINPKSSYFSDIDFMVNGHLENKKKLLSGIDLYLEENPNFYSDLSKSRNVTPTGYFINSK